MDLNKLYREVIESYYCVDCIREEKAPKNKKETKKEKKEREKRNKAATYICSKIKVYDNNGKLQSVENEIPYFLTKTQCFHKDCLFIHLKKMYKKDQELAAQKFNEIVAEHDKKLLASRRKGTMVKGQLDKVKEEKKDKSDFYNYLFGHYGLTRIPKKVSTLAKQLNDGTSTEYNNAIIPYKELLNMFIYYEQDLDSIRLYKIKHNKGIDDINLQLIYDLTIVAGRYNDYLNRPEVKYNESNNGKNPNDNELLDIRKYVQPNNNSTSVPDDNLTKDLIQEFTSIFLQDLYDEDD